MMTKDYKDPDWYKKRIEKALSSIVSGAKRLTDSSLKKISQLQDCSRTLLNDYSKLKKEAELLQKTKIVEEALISNMAEGVIVIDSGCKIILMNKKARDIFGFSQREKIVNSNYFEHIIFCHSDKTPIAWQEDPICKSFTRNKRGRITLTDDLYCFKKDGNIFPVTASISPFNVDETFQTVSVTIYDATKEKQTADIRSDFVSVASHQMKTPLSISNTHTELLLQGMDSPEEKEHLEEILYGNKKIEELVNRFFIISKIGSGTLSIFRQHHDLNQILDDILHELSLDIQSKHLTITKKYEPSCIGYVDSVLLRIALHNILSNAIKFNSCEGVVTIETKYQNGSAHISVSDTGCGIPEDERDHVFMKFYRGIQTSKNTIGTGMGLYITKSIIEQCGGKVSFVSEVGRGTTFDVSLPASSKK